MNFKKKLKVFDILPTANTNPRLIGLTNKTWNPKTRYFFSCELWIPWKSTYECKLMFFTPILRQNLCKTGIYSTYKNNNIISNNINLVTKLNFFITFTFIHTSKCLKWHRHYTTMICNFSILALSHIPPNIYSYMLRKVFHDNILDIIYHNKSQAHNLSCNVK